MQLSQSIRLKQKQSMVMTPRLQQAIRMLQMNNLDLASYLEDQALENPFLEVLQSSGLSCDGWGSVPSRFYLFDVAGS